MEQNPINPSPTPPPASGGSGLAPNVASMLCYLCTIITGIIFLVIEKRDREVQFHAWQAIFLGATSILGWLVFWILGFIFASIAAVLGGLISVVSMIFHLAIFVVWIIAMVKAFQGSHWLIPVIGNLAEQQVQKSNA